MLEWLDDFFAEISQDADLPGAYALLGDVMVLEKDAVIRALTEIKMPKSNIQIEPSSSLVQGCARGVAYPLTNIFKFLTMSLEGKYGPKHGNKRKSR